MAVGLTTTDYGLLVVIDNVVRVIAAARFAGAVLGATIGSIVRNVGGALIPAVIGPITVQRFDIV